MKKLKLLFTFLLVALLTTVGSSQSITTTFAGGNGGATGWAVMYDATIGPADLDITGFDVNSSSGAGTAFTLDFYTVAGGFAGNETNPGAWTLVGSGSGTSAGLSNPSNVTLATPVTVSAATTYGFAIVLTGASPAYTNGTGANQNFSNADITLALGSSVSGTFAGTVFNPRVWNGTVYYSTAAPPPPPAASINHPLGDGAGGLIEESFTVECGTALTDYFDSGGEGCDITGAGSYDNNANTVAILCPSDPGQPITLEFFEVDIETRGTPACWDFLTIHDGNSTAAPVLFDGCGEEGFDACPGGFAGDGSDGGGVEGGPNDINASASGVPANVNNIWTSSDATGCLTVAFTSDGSVDQGGWIATLGCEAVAVPGCDITCPADIAVPCEGGADPAVTGMATSGTDCVISFTDMTIGCNIARTWTSTAPSGQITTCVQNITLIDDQAPVITCPPNATLTCFETIPEGILTAADFVAAGGTISDNCTAMLDEFVVFSQTTNNGGDNCPGNAVVYTRTYSVIDVCGNVATCDQTFTYIESTQGPVITSVLPTCFKYCASAANPMASDITYDTDCSFGGTVNITGPTQIGQDNCPGSIYRYTYTVTDDCGRTSAPVTRDFIIGNDGPTIECPAFNLLLECGDPNNSDYIAAHANLVTANSSCELGTTINYFPQNFNNITCNTSTVVTFIATDACGRTASCTTTVNISDNTAPVITSVYVDGVCNEAVCGSNLNFWYNEWKDKVLEGLSATDACDSNVSFTTQGPFSPNQNCPDETTETVVAFVANDNCGNTSSIEYSFYVTAVDTPEPPQASSIAGMIHTESMEAVEDVEVYLSGGASFFDMYTTGSDGMYAFNNVPMEQNYSITPMNDQFPLNGVSSYDLVLISKHLLNIQLLDSPYKIIAADVNRSGSITTLDLVELRKMILFIDSEFANNTSWRFVDANFVFPDATNPFATAFPEIVDINGLVEAIAQDFVGVKTGDVNESAVPNNVSGADDRSFNGELNFKVKDQILEAGETQELVFTSNDFKAIAGYQYTLNFNTDLLEFVNVTAGDLTGMNESNFGLSLLNEGAITTSWTSNEAVSLKADAELFTVTFKAKQATQLSEALTVNSRYTAAEAYDVSTENGQLNLLNVNLRFEDAAAISSPFALMQNTPNPFRDQTVIGFVLPEATSATLTVFDVSGKQLKLISGDYEAGYNEVSLDKEDLAEGILYYQLETAANTATRKMLLINK